MGHYLFSFSGRINRAKQWAIILVALAFEIAGAIAVGLMVNFDKLGQEFQAKTPLTTILWTGQARNALIVLGLLYLLMLYVDAAVSAKRLHDRNKSAWWLLVFFVLPLVLNIPTLMLMSTVFHNMTASIQASQNNLPPPPMPQMPQSPLATLTNGAASIISIWAFVELYCLRGTAGDNRFGSDPLAPKG